MLYTKSLSKTQLIPTIPDWVIKTLQNRKGSLLLMAYDLTGFSEFKGYILCETIRLKKGWGCFTYRFLYYVQQFNKCNRCNVEKSEGFIFVQEQSLFICISCAFGG